MKLKRYVQRQGSKNSIVFELFDVITKYIPNHRNLIFVDLFGGGGAVSSNATYFFDKIIYNEKETGIYKLFMTIQDNNFISNLKEKWISREEFCRIRDEGYKNQEENMILTIWSFGNDRKSYLYGKTVERKKYLTHKIIFSKTEEEYKKYINLYNTEKIAHFEKYGAVWDCFLYDNDWELFKNAENRRYYKFGKKSNYYRKFYKGFDIDLFIEKRGNLKNKQDIDLLNDLQRLESLQRLQSLERLESLQRLQSLERLESLQRLQSLERLESLESLERLERLQSLERLKKPKKGITLFNKCYKNIELPNPNDCIIYLDPPYRGTRGYESEFDFDGFDKYVLGLKEKGYNVFISEYNFPIGEVVWSKNKRGFISQSLDNLTGLEKLYFIDNRKNKSNCLFS